MNKKISGWYRIGIVLSVLWVLVVSGFAFDEYFIRGLPFDNDYISFTNTLLKSQVIHDKNGQSTIKDIILDKKPKPVNPFDVACGETIFNPTKFFCVLFLPILGMWGLVLGVAWSVLWIKEGFKKQ